VELRAIEPDDVDRLEEMFFRLSPETVYRRFFAPIARPRPGVLRHFATVDHDDRDAVVAVVGDAIVGVARYDRCRDDPTQAEVAIVVEDAWQHHGIAHALLGELTRRAARHGIATFTAVVLPGNDPVLRLARQLAPDLHASFADGELALTIPL
jgi:RimJ/RimL family protein N-acetyltransferase